MPGSAAVRLWCCLGDVDLDLSLHRPDLGTGWTMGDLLIDRVGFYDAMTNEPQRP